MPISCTFTQRLSTHPVNASTVGPAPLQEEDESSNSRLCAESAGNYMPSVPQIASVGACANGGLRRIERLVQGI